MPPSPDEETDNRVLDLSGGRDDDDPESGDEEQKTGERGEQKAVESDKPDGPSPSPGVATLPPGSVPIQVFPSRHLPSSEEPLDEKYHPPVPLRRAQDSVPESTSWDDLRLDVQELMRHGSSYERAYQEVQQDAPLHQRFRRDKLETMLATVMVFQKLDSVLWVRFVPVKYLELASRYVLTPNFKAPVPWPSISPADDEMSVDELSSDSSAEADDPPFESHARSSTPLSAETRGRGSRSGKRQASESAQLQPSKRHRPSGPADDVGLSEAELRAAPVPDSEATSASWRYLGIRVCRTQKRNKKTVPKGFPDFTHLRRPEVNLALLQRWDPVAYAAFLRTRPWVAMFRNRIRHL